MPGKKVDKLKKAKYKESRLEGNSIRQGLRDAGYTEASASHSSSMAVVKCSEQEIMNEVKASDISVDWVISRLNNELISIDAKSSDRVRILELLGKYLNMFRDSNIQQVQVNVVDILKELSRPKPIDLPLTEVPKAQGDTIQTGVNNPRQHNVNYRK